MRIWIFVSCALALSGCAAEPTSQAKIIEEFPSMNSISFQECTGAGTRVDVPEPLVPAPVPPGWDGQKGLPNRITLFVAFCEHVSLGRFERGPVQVVVESHEKLSPPESCREGDYTFINVLTRMVWSDPEIAEAVQDELGIPSSAGTISMSTSPESLVTTVSWTIDGKTSSFSEGRGDGQLSDAPKTYRYVWADNARERLGLIDFSWDSRQTTLEPSVSYGSYSNPMLLAAMGTPVVVGTGTLEQEMFPGGDFKFYEGYECDSPLHA